MHEVIAALFAASLVVEATDGAARDRIESLIARQRFFDAHVHCIVGQSLASTPGARIWYAIRDAYSLWMLGDSDAAFDELTAAPDLRDRELLTFTAAWLRLKGGDETAFRRWIESAHDEDLRGRAALYLNLVKERDGPIPPSLLAQARDLRERPSISPAFVGVLSAALPGAGHASLGLWSDSAVAFTLNAVSIGSTVELARAGLVWPAIAAGLVASLFYVGGIVSSVSLASERNEEERGRRIVPIERVLFPELPGAGRESK